jgi:hypothetical protein
MDGVSLAQRGTMRAISEESIFEVVPPIARQISHRQPKRESLNLPNVSVGDSIVSGGFGAVRRGQTRLSTPIVESATNSKVLSPPNANSMKIAAARPALLAVPLQNGGDHKPKREYLGNESRQNGSGYLAVPDGPKNGGYLGNGTQTGRENEERMMAMVNGRNNNKTQSANTTSGQQSRPVGTAGNNNRGGKKKHQCSSDESDDEAVSVSDGTTLHDDESVIVNGEGNCQFLLLLLLFLWETEKARNLGIITTKN